MMVNAPPDLNPAQAEACQSLEGQLMVLAGPGTGKTRVITYRYLNLLALPGVDTDNILVLTFTEKAAREMEERISSLCQTGYKELLVSTFHAFALHFLKEEGHHLPSPRPFRIAPELGQGETEEPNTVPFRTIHGAITPSPRGAKSADREPTTTSAVPSRMRRHSS